MTTLTKTKQKQLLNTTKLLQLTLKISYVLDDTDWWKNNREGVGYEKPLYDVDNKQLMWVSDVNKILDKLITNYNKSPLNGDDVVKCYQLLITHFKSHSKLPPTTIDRIYDDKLTFSKKSIKSSLTKSVNQMKKHSNSIPTDKWGYEMSTDWDLFTHNLSTLHSILSCL
jgi:hypothetical protein